MQGVVLYKRDRSVRGGGARNTRGADAIGTDAEVDEAIAALAVRGCEQLAAIATDLDRGTRLGDAFDVDHPFQIAHRVEFQGHRRVGFERRGQDAHATLEIGGGIGANQRVLTHGQIAELEGSQHFREIAGEDLLQQIRALE